MPFSPVFDYDKQAPARFPQHIQTADIIPNLATTQREWNDFIAIVKGVYPGAVLGLDETPFLFRFLGAYAGEISFNGYKLNLYGANPLAAWTGKEFITPTGMGGFAGYPIGAVLQFFTEPPAGWQKLDGQFYYIEAGETNHNWQGSQNKSHNHPGSYVQPVNDGAGWDRAQGSIARARSANDKASPQIQNYTQGLDTLHSHDGWTAWEGGGGETDEARPPHVKCIFARRTA